ncbi:hypothetical protein [Croceivirga thetidis]|uniref:GyrI-like small molecule binding domain-containing protein n=1 Tax=Croceivirga thetidis TaxID=2721623 RepID=A0ABX1GLZ2_9FLAO|nr:hypothetical protein [Croceivirga thetidis]NKI30923.1 hypothetical protein [Croceivirga thetidis]
MAKKQLNTDRILGISAMLISLMTLVIFIYQTNIMREQSKLSVKPRLDFTTNFGGNDSITTIQEVIENKGLGPAIIDSIYFKFKEERYPIDIENFLGEKLPKVLETGYLAQSATLGRGTTISPGEERPIYTYVINSDKLPEVMEYLGVTDEGENPFPIEVIYTSIYEDELWKMDNNDISVPIKVKR